METLRHAPADRPSRFRGWLTKVLPWRFRASWKQCLRPPEWAIWSH